MSVCITFHVMSVAKAGEEDGAPTLGRIVADEFKALGDWLKWKVPDLDDDLEFSANVVIDGDTTFKGDITILGDVTMEEGAPWAFDGDDWITIDLSAKTIIHDTDDTVVTTLADAGKVIESLKLDGKRHIIPAETTYATAGGGSYSADEVYLHLAGTEFQHKVASGGTTYNIAAISAIIVNATGHVTVIPL